MHGSQMNAAFKWGWFGGMNTDCGCDSLYAAYFGTGLLLSYLVRRCHAMLSCVCLLLRPHPASVPVHRLLHPDLQARRGEAAPGEARRRAQEDEVSASGHARVCIETMGALVDPLKKTLTPA